MTDEPIRPVVDVLDHDWLLEQQREMRTVFLIECDKMDYIEHVTATQVSISQDEYRRKPTRYKNRKKESR